MSFMLLKTIHVSCAITSYILFFLRGIWKMNDSPIMQQRWTKKIPHMVDSLLLATALGLAVTIQQYPFVDAWLTAKVAGLLLYIGLGLIALRFGKTRTARLYAWLAAQVVFFYIVSVAATHNPVPFTQ